MAARVVPATAQDKLTIVQNGETDVVWFFSDQRATLYYALQSGDVVYLKYAGDTVVLYSDGTQVRYAA